MHSVEFTDPDGPAFTIQAFRGVRQFQVGIGSELRALSWPYTWTDGVNKSKCLQSDVSRITDPKTCIARYHPHAPYVHTAECARRPACDHPTKHCSCGFYAYFNASEVWPYDLYSQMPSIFAVIDGWGAVVTGTKGFRAQYARIRALSLPFGNIGRGDTGYYRARNPEHEGKILEGRILEDEIQWLKERLLERYPFPFFESVAEMVDVYPLNPGRALE